MKTPDEIKKALECCFYDSAQCGECPYYPVSCDMELVRDAREYIRQLEAGIAEWEDVAASPGAVEDMARENAWLHKQLDQVAKHAYRLEAERDAAIRDLQEYAQCGHCKHQEKNLVKCNEYDFHCVKCDCVGCACLTCDEIEHQNWEWRGVHKEETK